MKYVVDIRGELPKTGSLAVAEPLNVSKTLEVIAAEACETRCKYYDPDYPDEEHCYNCPLMQL